MDCCYYEQQIVVLKAFTTARVHCTVGRFNNTDLRFKHVCDSSSSTLQTNSATKEDGQHNIRKCSSEVHSLKIRNIKHNVITLSHKIMRKDYAERFKITLMYSNIGLWTRNVSSHHLVIMYIY